MSKGRYVLDASALLCFLFVETGEDRVAAILAEARMSAVNLSEVVAKLIDRGVDATDVLSRLSTLPIDVIPFEREAAAVAGTMRKQTREFGLSLGDRACLALAKSIGGIAVTTDRAWARLEIGVEVDVVR